MVLSGLALVVVGGWLTTQAIAGNLAGRIRSWASGTLTATPDAPPPPVSSPGGGGGGRPNQPV